MSIKVYNFSYTECSQMHFFLQLMPDLFICVDDICNKVVRSTLLYHWVPLYSLLRWFQEWKGMIHMQLACHCLASSTTKRVQRSTPPCPEVQVLRLISATDVHSVSKSQLAWFELRSSAWVCSLGKVITDLP